MPELSGGEVTIADLFRSLSAIQSSVAQLVTRLEVITERAQTNSGGIADHEARIRLLERGWAKLLGAGTLAGLAAGAASGWLAAFHH